MLIEEATCSLILSNSRLHPFRNFSLEAFRLMPYFREAVLGTLQRYLGALGYRIEISVIDNRTGNVAGKTSLSHV